MSIFFRTFAANFKNTKIMKHIYYLFAIAFALASCERNDPYTPPVSPSDDPIIAQANFKISVKQPLTVIVNDNSRGKKLTYDFGDGKSERCQIGTTITHRYDKIGTYKIRATVTGDKNTSDNYALSVNISAPKVYITGLRYIKIPEDGEYYYATLKDDDFFTTTWFNTTYTTVLNNSRLPYDFIFKEPVYMDGLDQDNYYTLYVYHNTKTSGNGTQCLKQNINTSAIKTYPESIRLNSDNKQTIIDLLFSYK